MKVLNLRCAADHRFEGWFGSEADYIAQAERGLTTCPLCGSADITRLPSAPHVRVSRTGVGPTVAATTGASTDAAHTASTSLTASASEPQAAWLRAVRKIVDASTDVGERFPEEARRMHYGDVAHRPILGRATADEARALLDEGIAVLPLPAAFKGPLQ